MFEESNTCAAHTRRVPMSGDYSNVVSGRRGGMGKERDTPLLKLTKGLKAAGRIEDKIYSKAEE